MAGSSEGEEENYWPGFVDALTTMVMVLTFVMMVLGIVVFTLSQNVSKNYMAAIATAVNVDANAAKQNLTPEQVKAEIIEAIKQLRERAGQPPPPPPTPAPSPKQEETEMALLQSIQEKEKALAQLKEAKIELQKVQQQMQDIKKEIEEARNTPIVVDDTVAQKTVTPAPEKRIEASTDSSTTPASAGAKATASEKALSIAFKDRAVLLDDDTRKEIESFAQRTKAGRFIVRGNAGGTSASITELRRTAYYRVMVVRKQLIESGIPADRVTVFVDDVADSSRNNDVSVSSTN
ncbi:MAG: hypothetical protein ACOYOJ_06320 [Alsobacter sp.]